MARKQSEAEQRAALVEVIAEQLLGEHHDGLSIDDALNSVAVMGLGDNQRVVWIPPKAAEPEAQAEVEGEEATTEAPEAQAEVEGETAPVAAEPAASAEPPRANMIDLTQFMSKNAPTAPKAKAEKEGEPDWDSLNTKKGGDFDAALLAMASGGN